MLSILFIIIGLSVLIYGADILIRGAGSISKKAGIPPLVVGLTVVAFGTSAPELVVNMTAAWKENTDIAIGNILGSNTVNILFILGVCSLITRLKVQKSTTWKEIPFALLAVAMVFFLGNDILLSGGKSDILSKGDGLVLLGFFGIFLYYIFGLAKNGGDTAEVDEIPVYSYQKSILLTIAGLAGLFIGGKLFVEGATDIARLMGVSDLLIGLTVVAIGTSLPELAASIMAARKGQSDLAVGNIVGSNIFNIFWILGVTAIIHPVEFGSTVNFDILVCFISTLLMFVFIFYRNKHELNKFHGIVFLLMYILYTTYLVIRG